MNENNKLNVERACAVLGYRRQGYYQKRNSRFDDFTSTVQQIERMAQSVRKGCPTRGCRAMYDEFGDNLGVGRDKTIAILQKLGYRVRYRKYYGRSTQAGTREFPNLLVEKTVTGINQVWQADMSHYLYGDRRYYCIYITDVYSQEIVGEGAYSSNEAKNYAEVLKRAISRQKKGRYALNNLIHHSDGGKQYESNVYKAICNRNAIQQSMCIYSYENPYAEKTNDIIKNGYLNAWKPKTLKELSQRQTSAVANHNLKAKKKVLGKLSPNCFKKSLANDNLYQNNYQLELKPRNPEQPRKRHFN